MELDRQTYRIVLLKFSSRHICFLVGIWEALGNEYALTVSPTKTILWGLKDV